MPRLTLDYDKTFEKTLDTLILTTDATTKADAIRRAVALRSYLQKEVKSGLRVGLFGPDNVLQKEIVLP